MPSRRTREPGEKAIGLRTYGVAGTSVSVATERPPASSNLTIRPADVTRNAAFLSR